MKFLCVLALFLGVTYAQVEYTEQWPKNVDNTTLAGARGTADSSGMGNGTCTLQFPGPVFWFHCENCDIVPSGSNSATGTYALAGPNPAFEQSGTIMFVVNFMDDAYNATDLTFSCDSTATNEATVYSFPNNMVQDTARSRVYDSSLNGASAVTLDFPAAVQNFTVDHPNTWEGGPEQFVITNLFGGQKEIWFQFNYLDSWFSAADISVSITENVPEEEEEARKRRNAHF